MRIAKYIAHSGHCSRRAAGDLISKGVVTINGQQVINFNILVEESDQVKIDGQDIKLSETGLWLYHKPSGVITSKHDPNGRPTVFQNLPRHLQSLISIGRLDYNSEGLLLMTNNGDLAKILTDPKNNIIRKYHIKVFGKVNNNIFDTVRKGITIKDMRYKPIKVTIINSRENNAWLEMELTEGKNREIRNILKFLNLKVSRLIRVAYGDFQLGDLKINHIKKTINKLDF